MSSRVEAARKSGLPAILSPEAAGACTQRREPAGAGAPAEDGEHGFLVPRGMAAPFAPPGEESRAQPAARPDLTAAIADTGSVRTYAPCRGTGRHPRVRAARAGTPSAFYGQAYRDRC